MSNEVKSPQNQAIATVRTALNQMKPQFAAVLPKSLTPERFLRVAMTACKQTPKLLQCSQTSLFAAIMRAAQLGLEPDGILGQAYLIPYGQTVQFIVGYKGLIDLARRSGEVSNIVAKEVYSNDEFSIDWSQDMPFIHKPTLSDDRGEITHFWALARFKDGGFHWDFMTKKEVESLRDKSNGRNNSVWKEHFVEMGKKTIIRRIAKYLPMSVQKAAISEDLIDAGKNVNYTIDGDIIIDNGEVIDQPKPDPKSALDAFAGEVPANTPTDVKDVNATSKQEEVDITPLLKNQTSTKEVATSLLKAIESAPPEERGGIFVKGQGDIILEALSQHGLGLLKSKFTALGIHLPNAA